MSDERNFVVMQARLDASPRTGTCARCGESFEDRSASQNRRFCSDNCRKRHCDDTTGRAACADCGAPMGAKSIWKGYQRCDGCQRRREHERVEARWEQIEAWWAEGLTGTQIAQRLGWTINHWRVECGRMRLAGRDMPHRRTPEQCARIREGRWAA